MEIHISFLLTHLEILSSIKRYQNIHNLILEEENVINNFQIFGLW